MITKKLPRLSGLHDFGAGYLCRWEDTGYCLAAGEHDDGEPTPLRDDGSDLCAACRQLEQSEAQ